MPRRAGRASLSDIPSGLSCWARSSPDPPPLSLKHPSCLSVLAMSPAPAATGPLHLPFPCLGNLFCAGKWAPVGSHTRRWSFTWALREDVLTPPHAGSHIAGPAPFGSHTTELCQAPGRGDRICSKAGTADRSSNSLGSLQVRRSPCSAGAGASRQHACLQTSGPPGSPALCQAWDSTPEVNGERDRPGLLPGG